MQGALGHRIKRVKSPKLEAATCPHSLGGSRCAATAVVEKMHEKMAVGGDMKVKVGEIVGAIV
jgi:hypothetical protein